MAGVLKRKSIVVLIIPLLIYTLIGQGILSGLVLCIGENEHVAVELDQNCPKSASSGSNLEINTGYDICLDIPILISSSDRNISSVQYPRVIRNMIDRASSFLSAEYVKILHNGIFPQIPSSITSTSISASLNTTILLI